MNALGHCHPDLVAALAEQAHKLQHISNIYTTQPAQKLAKELIGNTFAGRALFCNSGIEANETALKPTRKYGHDHLDGHKTEIISCLNSFHGCTLFTVSVGGQPKYSKDYASLSSDITHVPFNDITTLEAAVDDKAYAVIIEPIQGESGVLPTTQECLQAAHHLCDEHGVLLILDGVQTGMGRTSKLFACEHYDITPDIISSARTLGRGFPIGAILTTDRIAPVFGLGTRDSTSGGNPMACAVGSRAFDTINAPETLAHVEQQGQKLQTTLRKIGVKTGVFKGARGMGLLLSCVLTDKYAGRASEITAAALEHDLMVLATGTSVVRFAPSLLLSDEGLVEGLKRFKATLNG